MGHVRSHKCAQVARIQTVSPDLPLNRARSTKSLFVILPPSLLHFRVTMSPHRVEVLPSRAALSQYGISKNGFLPEESPLQRLPQAYYQPWERIMEELPELIETQRIRQKVDALPVLDTAQLGSETEWQRACSLLALIAQGYIWTGPEPSQVSLLATIERSWLIKL